MEDGSYFIDRNPKYFSIILEYLRTGELLFSHLNTEQRAALHCELDYFQIQYVAKVLNIIFKKHINTTWKDICKCDYFRDS